MKMSMKKSMRNCQKIFGSRYDAQEVALTNIWYKQKPEEDKTLHLRLFEKMGHNRWPQEINPNQQMFE